MKVTLALLMMVLGGEAIRCHICEDMKMHGFEVDSTTACEATSISTCGEEEDVCRTITMSYIIKNGATPISIISYECGTKLKEGADDSTCGTLKALHDDVVDDFKCESKYCDSDACNTGQVAQIPFFVLVATIAFYGLFL